MKLANLYEQLLREWAELASAPMDSWDTDRMNALVDQTQGVQLALRQTDAGKETIERLADDPDPGLRGWAAVHASAWNQSLTRRVMHELLALGGFAAFESKWTLKTLDAGKLNVDWIPPPEGPNVAERKARDRSAS